MQYSAAFFSFNRENKPDIRIPFHELGNCPTKLSKEETQL